MPLLVSLIGLLLLWAVSFIPTSRIYDHALASAYQLKDEGWPRNWATFVGRTEFDRGLTPDSLAVMTSYTLDRQHPENLLLKRIYSDPQVLGAYNRLVETVEGRVTMTESYSRYWMGFRVIIRPLLVFTAYLGMRIIATGLTSMLLILAAATTARRSSTWVAAALAASIGLIEPWAIAGTWCYSTCVILPLALITLLNCAGLELGDGRTFRLFCLFGALTQFFDFYTYPLLVCGLPMLILVERSREEGKLKYAGRLFCGWFLSWLTTWIINILTVSLFTEDNGIADALHSVAFRFGVGADRSEVTSYSVAEAFRSVWDYLGLPAPKPVLLCLLAVLLALYVFSRLRFGKNEKLAAYLAVCALPLLWIAATAQPIIIHTSMQYRNVCILYFALMLYGMEALGILSGKNRLTAKIWKT